MNGFILIGIAFVALLMAGCAGSGSGQPAANSTASQAQAPSQNCGSQAFALQEQLLASESNNSYLAQEISAMNASNYSASQDAQIAALYARERALELSLNKDSQQQDRISGEQDAINDSDSLSDCENDVSLDTQSWNITLQDNLESGEYYADDYSAVYSNSACSGAAQAYINDQAGLESAVNAYEDANSHWCQGFFNSSVSDTDWQNDYVNPLQNSFDSLTTATNQANADSEAMLDTCLSQ